MAEKDLVETMEHLGNVLYVLADLDEGDRCQAIDDAIEFYNNRNPAARVEPTGMGVTYLVNIIPGLGIGGLTRQTFAEAGYDIVERLDIQEISRRAQRKIRL